MRIKAKYTVNEKIYSSINDTKLTVRKLCGATQQWVENNFRWVVGCYIEIIYSFRNLSTSQAEPSLGYVYLTSPILSDGLGGSWISTNRSSWGPGPKTIRTSNCSQHMMILWNNVNDMFIMYTNMRLMSTVCYAASVKKYHVHGNH